MIDEDVSPVDGTLTPVPIPMHPAQSAELSRLEVDFGRPTGPVHGGATGMLYGLSDPGIPARQLVSGARPRTVAQKSPGGAQHPNGDALEIAPDFVAAGGKQVLVYLQDDYAQWPYEFLGIEDYAKRVAARVQSALETEHAQAFAWVPFNEPDWIWYRDWASEKERFYEHWARIYHTIRTIDPHGPIVGPNEMEFRPARLKDFLTWAKANDVLPDVMSWHELEPGSLGTFDEHLRDYRALEHEIAIGPLPINIDEYGNRRDMSVPGQMVQWIAMFERAKVDANIAYWTMAGNLDDHSVQNSGANGGWWLLFWYARLTGHTIQVNPPHPGVPDTLQALAAIEAERRRATVILGGTAGVIELVMSNPSQLADHLQLNHGDLVRIVVEQTPWTGQEGLSGPPTILEVLDLNWAGTLPVVSINERDKMSAYRVTISAGNIREGNYQKAHNRPVVRLEAEDAHIEYGQIRVHDDDAQKYASSGGRDVAGLVHAKSAVNFTVTTPLTDTYEVVLTYGTAGKPDRLALYVDEEFVEVLDFPATLSDEYRGQLIKCLDLESGQHELSLRTSGPQGEVGGATVSLDCLEIRKASKGPVHYALRDADITPGARQTGSLLHLNTGEDAHFWLSADEDGYHEINIHLLATTQAPQVSINGTALSPADGQLPSRQGAATFSIVAFLSRGITELVLTGSGEATTVHGLTVGRRPEHDGHSTTLVAGSNVNLEATPLNLKRPSTIPAGPAVVTIGYANGYKLDAENYNTDVVTLGIHVKEEGGAGISVPCRHSYSWDNFWTTGAVIDLITDTGAIQLSAVDKKAPRIASVQVSPLVTEFGWT